jgi:hypothetical protein
MTVRVPILEFTGDRRLFYLLSTILYKDLKNAIVSAKTILDGNSKIDSIKCCKLST